MTIPDDIRTTLYDALLIARVFHEYEFENMRAVANIDTALAWLKQSEQTPHEEQNEKEQA